MNPRVPCERVVLELELESAQLWKSEKVEAATVHFVLLHKAVHKHKSPLAPPSGVGACGIAEKGAGRRTNPLFVLQARH